MNTLGKITEAIYQETGFENSSESTTLEEIGVDSLEFVSLMHAISSAAGEIPESEWAAINTVGDIARIAESHAHVSG
jgi:acyl carrier protein